MNIKKNIYPKLAATGMGKNKRTYGALSHDLYLYDLCQLSAEFSAGE